MKKFLLSMALVAGFTATAAEVTEDFKTANEWFGITDKNSCTAEVKTVTSPVSNIEYSYIYTYASKNNGIILQGTDNTKVENGGYVTFKLSIDCAEITLMTGATASTAAVVNVYAGETLIKENLALNAQGKDFKVEVPAANRAAGTVYKIDNISKKNAQFQSMTCSSEQSGPVEPTGVKFTKATTLENGIYVFAVNQDGTLKLARPYIGTAAYGRMNLIDATLDGQDIVTEEENAFEITVADGKATIKNDNRYYAMDDPSLNHLTSFQFYDALNEGCYWTYEFVDGAVKFTNALSTECFISQSKGGQGTWYTNVAPAKNPAEFNLPMLYKKASSSAIETVEAAEADAPVVYYNLQGVRVANPENGLYIRVQGNKVEKVALR